MKADYVTAGVLLGALAGWAIAQWLESRALARELKAIEDKRRSRRVARGWEGVEP